ncbi:hypothetical protein [Nannocystis pusilla]|uniref:hypothetical protein n=1 Tax=Nannocystis pusilla TaxID=889268 RepID=UPI003B81DDFD
MRYRLPFTRTRLLLFVSMVLASCGGQHATAPSAKTSPVSEGLQAPPAARRSNRRRSPSTWSRCSRTARASCGSAP